MNGVVEKLFAAGVVAKESVKEFLKEKTDELKVFARIQEVCGSVRRNATNLSMIRTWRSWRFGDEMILEAAKRSCTSASPIPYMNKILSDWKRQEIFEVKEIPENETAGSSAATRGGVRSGYVNPAIEAANAKSERERYYALLREKAQTRADRFAAKANGNARFKEIAARLSKMEIELAKAEVFEPTRLPVLNKEKTELFAERKEILAGLGIDESDLVPKFACGKCSDTGFLKDGSACDCYKSGK